MRASQCLLRAVIAAAEQGTEALLRVGDPTGATSSIRDAAPTIDHDHGTGGAQHERDG